ncbi:hypothetical protein Pcinc_020982 [Petrolisthes cinctipes]|uniref:Uncharacterized protein n=1 Tax=Petrolisthes cinctipes TaxID=88211 RepID=A0AAE1FIB9_PETCI|nr:hypothetical protein Pcinc_020982 [Petrolisthes cinctipes]
MMIRREDLSPGSVFPGRPSFPLPSHTTAEDHVPALPRSPHTKEKGGEILRACVGRGWGGLEGYSSPSLPVSLL